MAHIPARITRRTLLWRGLGAAGLVALPAVLAACGAPAAPTAAPAAPTAAPKAAEPTKPAAAATTAPAAQATTAPAAAAKPGMTANLSGQKMVVWGWQSFTPQGDEYLGNVFSKWGKDNGGEVEYNIVENAVFTQKLAAAIEAKALPDGAMLSNVLFYKEKGILVDMTSLFNEIKDWGGGFYESTLAGVSSENKVWSIPWETGGVSPMFTRLDLVEKATGKREAPKTLVELEEVATKVNNPPNLNAIGLCLGRMPDTAGNAQSIIWNEGGVLVDKTGTKPALNSPETVGAVEYIKRWFEKKLIPADAISWDDTGNNNAYQSKRAAFVINPASIYAWLVANDQQLLADTEMAPVPKGKAGTFSGAGGWSWSVTTGAKNREAATAMFKYVMQPEVAQRAYEAVGGRWYPVYKGLADHPFWKSKPQFKGYPELVTNARFASYPAPPEPKLMSALGEVGTTLVLADMVQAVVVTKVAPAQAVADAQQKMEQIFAKYKLGG
ncbi:MAG: extracellular solute-binding protein [Chloroflexi bacterium]|nr:extracellular solute-binding protein [Chloroflexota bacterium]